MGFETNKSDVCVPFHKRDTPSSRAIRRITLHRLSWFCGRPSSADALASMMRIEATHSGFVSTTLMAPASDEARSEVPIFDLGKILGLPTRWQSRCWIVAKLLLTTCKA